MVLIESFAPAMEDAVLPGKPEVLTRRDVLYVPRVEGGRDSSFGLFSRTGRQILDNALFQFFPPRLKSQQVMTSLHPSANRPRLDGEIVYGGAISDHYGHFITECLNTLWYCLEVPSPERKILFHGSLSVEEMFAIPWIREILLACGIRPEQVLVPRMPVVVNELILPGQAFSEDGFVYEHYGQAGIRVGQACLPPEQRRSRTTWPVYLSRAGLARGTRQLVNEDELIHALQGRGVTVVSPERMSVREQIALFVSHPVIGIMGSAWHTSIFSEHVRGVALCLGESVYRSYPLMDAVHDASVAYVDVEPSGLEGVLPAPGFSRAVRIRDPEGVAHDLLERLGQVMRPVMPDGQGAGGTGMAAGPHHRGPAMFRLYSREDEPVMLHMPTERVEACRQADMWHVPILVLVVDDAAFLCAAHDLLPCMEVACDEGGRPFLSYRLVKGEDGTVSFRHPGTGLWLKAPPSSIGLPLHADGVERQSWEQFRLVPHEMGDGRGRLHYALGMLRRLCRGGMAIQGGGADQYGLFRAWRRVFPKEAAGFR